MSKGNRAQYTLEFKMRSDMKRLLLGLMLLMIATAASAEWTIAGGNATADSYVDRATIRRNGNFVKMWNLMDYKTVKKSVAGKSYLSSKVQREYADCKEETTRLLALALYAGKMGTEGVVLWDSEASIKWSPMPPESPGEVLLEIACGKK